VSFLQTLLTEIPKSSGILFVAVSGRDAFIFGGLPGTPWCLESSLGVPGTPFFLRGGLESRLWPAGRVLEFSPRSRSNLDIGVLCCFPCDSIGV
jgi:hypothetical protein